MNDIEEIAEGLNKGLRLGLGASWLRADVAKGIELKEGKPKVDRESGVIYGYSVVKKGPALGHNMEIDEKTLDQVVALGNKSTAGIKSRFDHPNASSTSMGTFLGRSKNFRRDGESVRADLHLSEASKDAPQGDLYTYTLALAEKDPEAFGASMVFDGKAETRLNEDGTPARDKDGKPLARLARVERLYASDVVDDPAANPDGLFSAEESLAEKCSAFLNRWSEHSLRRILLSVFEPITQKWEAIMTETKDAVIALTEEQKKEAFAAGVKAERERVKGVRVAFSGVYGDKPSAENLAACTEVIECGASVEDAERTFKLRKLAQIEVAAPASAGGGDERASSPKVDLSALPLEDRCKTEWDTNADGVRQEFETLSQYLAFKKAEASGSVKILKK